MLRLNLIDLFEIFPEMSKIRSFKNLSEDFIAQMIDILIYIQFFDLMK